MARHSSKPACSCTSLDAVKQTLPSFARNSILTFCATACVFTKTGVLATTSVIHLWLLATAGGTSYTIPAPSVSSCAFAEFNYALKQLQSSYQTKPAALARQAASSRGNKEPQLASAFTREEAAAGCAVDEEDDDAGESNTSANSPCLGDWVPLLKEADDMHNGIGPIAELLAEVDLTAGPCWLHSTWSSI